MPTDSQAFLSEYKGKPLDGELVFFVTYALQ